MTPERGSGLGRSLIEPLRHRGFRSLLLFHPLWTFGAALSDPFFNVFMIRDLQVSYATIGILNVIVLAVGVLGYRVWGAVVASFGSKPVLQLLLVPRFLLPFVWVFLTPSNAAFLLPVIMAVNGFVFSGLTVAISTLLLGTVPEGSSRPSFFAAWAFANALVIFGASATGAGLSSILSGTTIQLAGITIGSIKLTFACSGFLLIIPLGLLPTVTDVRAKPLAHLFGQARRGNTLSFAYNAFFFSWMRQADRRAGTLRKMARSKSPIALKRLIEGVSDADPTIGSGTLAWRYRGWRRWAAIARR